jgi:signal transduction histidine kinase
MIAWKSLRTRLTLYSACIIFLAAIVCAIGTTWHIRHEQLVSLDLSLKQRSRVIAHLLAKAENPGGAKRSAQLAIASEPGAHVVHVWDLDGNLVLNIEKPRLGPPPSAPPRDGARRVFRNLQVGEQWLRIGLFREANYTVEVGAGLARVNDTIGDLLHVYSFVLPALLLVILLGGFWLAGRALKPISELAHEAETITAEQLDHHLPVRVPDDEIGRLSTVLNEMLERLRVSFLQSRRFSADASHELKTPLTIVRGHLEAALYTKTSPADLEDSLASALEEVDRLARIIDGLLLLSRSDARQLRLELRTLNFSEFIVQLVEDAELLTTGANLELETKIMPNLWIRGHDAYLRQLVLNLFDNACKYNHHGGKLRLVLAGDATAITLEVANTGPGIPAEQLDRVFERFYRGDAARNRQVDGLGLGLAIGLEIARAHQANFRLISSDAAWTRFELRFTAVTPSLALSL